ncbi:penicillin-binding transpeptidase domain-containing protein [uncultured Tateyamaria sp.]|uniref:penicillin-binding transpeptidase domain-containing protein n=1 Tax=uncultured Tateyamaria sp. TaxID=455651 RepID=UPI002606BE0A|nr:penicillin-binding transpeptidase domain-containing protein [uncultured Tateyamaria sp.]
MRFSPVARLAVRLSVCLALLGGSVVSASAETVLSRDQFSDQMGDRQSSFLARDLMTGTVCRLEGSDLETRHAPWSTFKIPNTLIALETGAAAGIDHWRDWDPAQRPALQYWPEAWRQGQTLKTAFQRSAVWYFQDIAFDIGSPSYRTALEDWRYGNAVVPDGSDAFWLGGPLKLSVDEQVGFLTRMVQGDLGVQSAHLADLMNAAHAGPLGSATLYGKTGSGPVRSGQFSGKFEGWYVGWLTRGDDVFVVFAHHVTGPYFDAIRTYRRDFAETLLTACGLTGAQQ